MLVGIAAFRPSSTSSKVVGGWLWNGCAMLVVNGFAGIASVLGAGLRILAAMEF